MTFLQIGLQNDPSCLSSDMAPGFFGGSLKAHANVKRTELNKFISSSSFLAEIVPSTTCTFF